MATTTDYRALCAELLSALENEGYAHWVIPPDEHKLCLRARAALAQPAPEGQSSLSEDYWRKDALQKLIDAATRYRLGVFSAEELELFEDRARAVLARWGRPAIEPVPESIGPEWQPCVKLPITVHVREQRPGETHVSTREGITPVRPDDLIMRGVQGEEYPIGRELFEKTYQMGESELAQPAPVQVSERLPEPEDCFPGDYGQRSYKCWAQQYHTDSNGEPLQTVAETWDLVDYRLLARCHRWYYAWLPHHALPVPTTRREEN